MTTHLRFKKSLLEPTSLIIDEPDNLGHLCRDVVDFEKIVCRHTAQRPQTPAFESSIYINRTSFYRNPQEHILFCNITALTIPLHSQHFTEIHKLCKSAFQYMEVADLTVEVMLDDTSFPSLFSDWGNSFLGSVKHLTFKFSADGLDKDMVSNTGLFIFFISCLGVKFL